MSTLRKASGDSDEGPSTSTTGGGPPPRKIHKIMFEPKKLVSVSTLEDMDAIVAKFQIAKIRERLEARTKEENELRLRIEQLEKRQTQDDAVLNVVNRYWNQLNEDIRIMLQRFDTETSDEIESNNENAATTSFLSEMAKYDKNELDEKLAKKVQVSTRAVTKMVQAFDRLFQRSEKISAILKAEVEADSGNEGGIGALDDKIKGEYIQFLEENKQVQLLNTSLHTKFRTMSLQMKELAEKLMGEETEIDEMKNRVSDLEYEFEDLNADCKKKADLLLTWKDRVKEVEDLLGKDNSGNGSPLLPLLIPSGNKELLTSSEIAHLQKEQEELTDLAEERRKELELLKQQHIATLHEIDRLNKEIHNIPEQTVMETTEYKCLQSKFSVIYHESLALRGIITEVKKNLYSVNSSQQSQTKEMEVEEGAVARVLATDMVSLEDMLTQLKKEYEMLRLEFEKNAAANEQVAPVHREMRNLITQLQQHNQQIKLEGQRFRGKCTQIAEENGKIKKHNVELIGKVEKLQQVKKERLAGGGGHHSQGHHHAQGQGQSSGQSSSSGIKPEMVKTEAGAAAGSTSTPATQDKSETVLIDLTKIKVEGKGEELATATPTATSPTTTIPSGQSPTTATPEEPTKPKTEPGSLSSVKPETGKVEPGPSSGTAAKSDPVPSTSTSTPVTFATPAPPPPTPPIKKISEAEQAITTELKSQLKKCLSESKEMKLLLDMYKGQNKEQTDRVDLMVLERKARLELDESRQELKKLNEVVKKEEKKKVAEEDLSSKIKVLEERTSSLRRQIGAQKQEEEALLNEMDVTGQAFEDMQEQNSRLIQQLREKENANFKLMSDRIKANRVQELVKEEKEAQQKNNQILMEHLSHKNTVIRKLEEIEQQLVGTIAVMEKESMVRQQAMELNKRKAIESAQSAADLKLHLEKYHSQMKEAQQLVAEKTSALAAEAFKSKRYSEELSILTSRLERLKKIEMSGNTDEVVLAEIQEYKDMLTCPSCKVRRKDAVLTKCFHVFCFDCLRTRYETRQRKCPRCNAAFGANDYHRLYLS